MLANRPGFSGFSATDIAAEKAFYSDTLGVDVTEENGMLSLHLEGGQNVLIYPKDDHQPATFTVLNFQVDDIDATVDAMVAAGVKFEKYDGVPQDERGIQREYGPPIAWFKDPEGNILSVIEESGS
jgi:predicted enzyme related to lactoylglutathione lyase